ncbi:hypothetical protein [Pseudogulbenkiania sp. NH8B]|nr:hypothetical protein [Pseudogulbenkiania sp. NH8B]
MLDESSVNPVELLVKRSSPACGVLENEVMMPLVVVLAMMIPPMS